MFYTAGVNNIAKIKYYSTLWIMLAAWCRICSLFGTSIQRNKNLYINVEWKWYNNYNNL